MFRRLLLLLVLSHCYCANAGELIEQATYQQSALSDEEVHAKSERAYHMVRTRGANAASVALLLQLCRDLPDETSAKLFARLAKEWHTAGEIDLAGECRRTLLQKFPSSPEAKAAFLDLIQTYSSGEVAHAHRLTSAMKTSAEEGPANRQMLTYAGMFATQQLKANKALQTPTLDWYRGTIQRLLGKEKAAIGLHTPLKRRQPGDFYRKRVDFEEWLAGDRESEAPISTIACVLAAERPHLDGVLNEPMWNDTAIKNLAAKPQAVTVQFACDSEYLYVAAKVARKANIAYEPDERPRSRDADLSQFDRVRFLLDVDRDYATAYEMTIDHRGWTSDACWGDATWNPEWFVAANSSETHWQVEVALAWNSLVDSSPAAGDAWAVRCERLLPEHEVAAKPQAAGFSVLLFE